jgi:Ca2+-binding EF-hand superfamily protein
MPSTAYRILSLAVVATCVAPAVQVHAKPMSDLAELLEELDDNNDKKLSRQEFIGDYTGHARERVQTQFNALDKNRDNVLMLRELKELMRRGRE